MNVLMLFLDGVGIGNRDPAVNPLFAARLPALRSLFDGELPSLRARKLVTAGATVIPLDATLGVPGLPQSGTGQTALFTGVNGAALIGRHFGPHPYSTLKPVIEERNIFRQVLEAGKTPCFANAFPRRFFEYVEQKRSRLTVTTMSCMAAGVPLRTGTELGLGTGVSADITGEGWHTLGHPETTVITPEEAGRRLVRLTASHEFVLFEYWKPDHAGHAMDRAEAIAVMESFDRLLAGILGMIDPARTLLVITSDHGNIEDITVKTHTRHPVPLIVRGHGHREFVEWLSRSERGGADLTSVTPAIMQVIQRGF
jgi:2,3-bisphosphoglycerate-independent phosphoglycerate mutase